MKNIDWKALENKLTGQKIGNYILLGKGFYISYNPDTKASELGNLLDSLLGGFLGENSSSEETALVKRGKNEKYYILIGDFRKEYEKLVPLGFNKCYEFYKNNPNKSKWDDLQ